MVADIDPALGYDPTDDALNRRTAQSMVAERLRVEILSGVIAPGTRLLQTKVAERMKTSTTPVREAMAELSAEGLVDLDPHRGVIVHRPTVEELHEVYEMRSILDPVLMAKTVDNITHTEIARAAALCDRMEAETEAGAWVVLNSHFHAVLDQAARSPLLATTVRNLRNRSAIYIAASLQESPERMVDANAEHAAMVDACRRGDPQEGLEPTRSHIGATVGLVTRYLQRLEAKSA